MRMGSGGAAPLSGMLLGFSTRQGSEKEHGGGSGIFRVQLGRWEKCGLPVPNPIASSSS